MQRGQRTINGKVYNQGGRVTGINAKQLAISEAETKRARGKSVRIIKVSNTDYLIYEI